MIEQPDPPFSAGVLRRLAIAARLDRESFLARHARWRRLYGNRLEAVVVVEGARRQLEGSRVAPLEVWTLFRHHPDGAFPSRRRRVPINRYPWRRVLDHPTLAGRPLTLASVSIEAAPFDKPADVVRRYLTTGRSPGTRRMARGLVMVLEPATDRGKLVRPPLSDLPLGGSPAT